MSKITKRIIIFIIVILSLIFIVGNKMFYGSDLSAQANGDVGGLNVSQQADIDILRYYHKPTI